MEFFDYLKVMEDAGFVLLKSQQSYMQSRGKELVFEHPRLLDLLRKEGYRPGAAKKFYIKRLSDDNTSEIGLSVGKSSPLIQHSSLKSPNARDTFEKYEDCTCWVNRENDRALDELLTGIKTLMSYDVGNLHDDFMKEVFDSLSMNSEVRKSKLANSQKKPKARVILTKVFERNPHVVAEVLSRANGVCESCSKLAPFNRKSDGTPYLEVHHKIKLADSGDDTIDNAIALCPNCHRKKHFG